MAAPLGFFTVVDNVDVIAADHMNSAVMQGVPFFASTAARDGAWPAPHIGAVCYVTSAATGQGWYRNETGTPAGWRLFMPFGVAGPQTRSITPVWEASDTTFAADGVERAIPGSQFNLAVPSWATTAQVVARASGWTSPGAFNTSNRLRIGGSTLSTAVRARGSSALAYGSFPVTAYRGTNAQLVWMLTVLSGAGAVTSTGATSTAYLYDTMFV